MSRIVGALAAVVAFLLTACGVPTDDAIRDIDAGSVPSGLVDGPAAGTPVPTEPISTSTVYFTAENGLVGVQRTLDAPTAAATLQALMTELTEGPEQPERAGGLSSALPPTMILTVTDLTDGVATIDLTGEQLPTADQTAAVGQIVLSATSIAAITSVRLTLEGEALDAPLVDGAQTSRPLTADDYEELLAPNRG